MLSKEGFCKALQMIKEQESIAEQFSKALNLVGNGHFVFGTENKYLLALRDVLKEAVNDQYDYIDWWLYEAADDFVLAPGGISHSGPGGNRQFWPDENS